MRFTRTRLIAAGVLPLALLTACGSEKSADDASKSSSPTSPASPKTVAPNKVASINDISVTTPAVNKPAVKVATKPFSVNKTTTKVLKPGAGTKVGTGDIAYVSYVAVNGTTGKTIESTFGKPNAAFNLASKDTFPGLLTALRGQQVGSEIVTAVPPAEGFGSQGNKDLGISANDTMIFYVKVNDQATPLKEVKGTQEAPKAGLPTVAVPAGPGTQAKITVPKGAKAPAKLESQVLIKGKGKKVAAGQRLMSSYTGQIWSTGAIFDSTAKQGGAPATFPIGVQQVIPGWDKVLVGQTVGSRVLIVVPPADGYGKEGNPQGGIKGTDTLVFVVDILAAL